MDWVISLKLERNTNARECLLGFGCRYRSVRSLITIVGRPKSSLKLELREDSMTRAHASRLARLEVYGLFNSSDLI